MNTPPPCLRFLRTFCAAKRTRATCCRSAAIKLARDPALLRGLSDTLCVRVPSFNFMLCDRRCTAQPRSTFPAAYRLVVVASPALFQVQCKTPRQIELANAFCRYLEMARPV